MSTATPQPAKAVKPFPHQDMADDQLIAWLRPGQRVELAPSLWAERSHPSVGFADDVPKKPTGPEYVDTASSGGEHSSHSTKKPDGIISADGEIERRGLSRLQSNRQLRVLIGIPVEGSTPVAITGAIHPACTNEPNAIDGDLNETEVSHPHADCPLFKVNVVRCRGGIDRKRAAIGSPHATRLPDNLRVQLDLITLHGTPRIDHAKDGTKQCNAERKSLLKLQAGHNYPFRVRFELKHILAPRSIQVAWIAVTLVAGIFVPLRIAEIHQAHVDRDSAKPRWEAISSVRR